MKTKRTRVSVALAVFGLLMLALAPMAIAATAVPKIDLQITKADSADPVAPGQRFDYILTARNNGPSDALAVWVVDTLPAQVTYASDDSGCSHASGTVQCSLGTVAANVTKTIKISVTVNAGVTGTFTNTAVVENREVGDDFFPAPEDTDPTNNQDTEDTTVLAASIGDRVWNDANRNGVQDVGEAGLTGVTVNLSGAATASTVTGADGAYLFSGLAAGGYTVTVAAATGPAGYTLTTAGSFTRTLAAGEAYLMADFGLAAVPAEVLIDLEVTKTVAPASVTVGQQATFTLGVTNKGPNAATGVVLKDTLPAGLTYVSSAGAGSYDAATGTWTVGSLAVGASASRTLVVTVSGAGGFTNPVEVTAAGQKDSDSVPADGKGDDFATATVTATAVLASGQIGDTVFLDTNSNKVQDAGEAGIAGARVTLTAAGGAVTTATTDATGKYLFAALGAGTYTVKVDSTSVADDLSLTTAGTFTATITDGGVNLDADFGFTEVLPKTGADLGLTTFAGLLLLAIGAALLRKTALPTRR